MSSFSKGKRNERKAQLIYENQGWKVEKVRSSGRFQKQKDFFEIADLICLKGKCIKFVQVKTNQKPPLKQFEKFCLEHCCENISFEIIVFFDRKEYKIFVWDYIKLNFLELNFSELK